MSRVAQVTSLDDPKAGAFVGPASISSRSVGFAPGTDPRALAPSVQRFARATRFRSSAFNAGADELKSGEESRVNSILLDMERAATETVNIVIEAGKT